MAHASRSPITGLILAGGQSRRMRAAFETGAGDKGLLDIGGQPMLGHVIARLQPQAGPLAINANGDPSRFAQFKLPVIADLVEGYAGPLSGILAGLRWSAQAAPQATHMVSVSTDAPLIPDDLVTRLAAGLEDGSGAIALARSGGALHPVIGLWPVALADDLEDALRAGTRKVLEWTDRYGTVPVDFPFRYADGRSIDPFFNANTPEELDDVRKILGNP